RTRWSDGRWWQTSWGPPRWTGRARGWCPPACVHVRPSSGTRPGRKVPSSHPAPTASRVGAGAGGRDEADERGPRGRSTSTGPLGQQLGGSAALLDVCLQLGQPQLARAGALGHLLVLALGVPRVDLAGPTDLGLGVVDHL